MCNKELIGNNTILFVQR